MSKSSSLVLLLVCALHGQEKFVAEEAHMGTVFRISVYGTDPVPAFRAAFDRISVLDAELSDYAPNSELNRICREAYGKPAPISDDLYRVLQTAMQLSADSNGAFDVTIGPVTRLWRLHKVPGREELGSALKLVNYRNILLSDHRVELKLPGMQLDLGAIAKGFAAEEALKILRVSGFPRALVAGSGDLAIGDSPPNKQGWSIGLDSYPYVMGSMKVQLLHNTFVGTSGDTEQFTEAAGTHYSHIVDPNTGIGLTQRVRVSVIAPNGMLADALGTTLSVVAARWGAEAAKALVAKYPGAWASVGFDPVVAAEEKRDHHQDHK